MTLTIPLTVKEQELATSYAKLHSMTVDEAFKQALFEKIEDEYDKAVGDDAYREYLADGKKSRPIEQLWQELEL